MTWLDQQSRVRRHPRIVSRATATGGVLLHLDTGAYHGLNPIGVLVWELLERDVTFGELIDLLQSRLDGAPSTLPDEIRAFLHELHQRGLVQVKPDQEGPT